MMACASLSVFLTAFVTSLSSDSACGNKSRSHFQGFALFGLDARETVLGTLARFGVGHAEHIVGLNAAVNATVTGNRSS